MEKTAFTFIMRATSTLMTLLMNVYIARLFGADGAGLFSLSITFLLAISIFGRFGLGSSVIKFIAPAWEKTDKRYIFGVYLQTIIISLIICIVLSVLVYISSDYLAEKIFNDIRLIELFILISFVVFPYCLVWIHSGMLKGINMPAKATFVEACGMPLFTIMILFFYSLNNSMTYVNSLVAYCFATIITCFIGAWFIFKYTFTREQPKYEQVNEIFNLSYPIMWYTGLKFIINWSPIIFLGALYTSTDVGLYAVAFRISIIVTFLLIVVNSITPAPIATLYKNNEFDKLQTYTKSVAVNTTRFAIPLTVIIFIWHEQILLLFGQEFLAAKYLLLIIVLGKLVQVLTGTVDNLLIMTGHEQQLKNSMILVAIISFILNFLLIKYFGAIGAALTTALCISLKNIFAAWLVYHYLNIKLIPTPTELLKIK